LWGLFRLVAGVEESLAQAFSSSMGATRCAEEGYDLAIKLGVSPYETGVFEQPPLVLLKQWSGLTPFAEGGTWNVFVAIVVHYLFEAAGSKSLGRFASFLVLAFGQSLGLEEAGILLALLGSLRGSESLACIGAAAATYLSPRTTCLLAWPLFKIASLRRKSSVAGLPRARAFLAFLAKIALVWCALAAASSVFLKTVLGLGRFGDFGYSQVTAHWLKHSYGQHGAGPDALAPSASLAWYFNVQMFPEMKKMFGILVSLQPLLLAVPLALELDQPSLCSHLFLAQVLVCNLFRWRYHLGHFLVETISVCAFHAVALGGKPSFSMLASGSLALICVSLLHATRVLWIEEGVANSNFYWAMAIGFNLARMAILQSVLVQARESLEAKDTRKNEKKEQ